MKLLISTVAAQIVALVRETAAQALDQLSEIFPAISLQTPMQQSKEPFLCCTSCYSCLQVVAPVRETAAQALGSAARGLPRASLQKLMRHLTALVAQEEWGVRLAGLLGIKYVLAARLDQAGALLPTVLPAVLTGLKVCSLCSSIM